MRSHIDFSGLTFRFFYNEFVDRLDDLVKEIKSKNFQKAVQSINILNTKLQWNGREPFPGYQDLFSKLAVAMDLFTLSVSINDQYTNREQPEKGKNESFNQFISKLKALAHFFNFLHIINNNLAGIKINTIANLAQSVGLFNEPRQLDDCSDNAVSIGGKKLEPIQNGSQESITIMSWLKSLEKNQLESLYLTLFSSMDTCVEKEHVTAWMNEKNLFKRGTIEFIISQSNLYKEAYKKQLQQAQSSEEDAQENSATAYNLLSKVVGNLNLK